MKKVYFSHGEKGGVGKSVTAVLLVEHLVKKGGPVIAVEGDITIPDFGKKMDKIPGAEVHAINLRDLDAGGWSELTGVIADAPDDASIVVNLGSGMMATWHHEIGLFCDACMMADAEVTVFWTIDRQMLAIAQLVEAMQVMETEPSASKVIKRWVAVKNLVFGAPQKFELFDGSSVGKMMAANGDVIHIPEISDAVAYRLNKDGLPFSYVHKTEGTSYTLYERSACFRALNQSEEQFKKVI